MGLIISSSSLARIATQMFAVLIVLFVLETHHSSEFSGLVVVCSQIPGILFSPIAGALLDRGARVQLMMIDYLLGAASIGAIGVLSLLHHLPDLLLVAIVVAGSITNPLSRVGARSVLPLIVPRRLWDRANAVDGASGIGATVLGPGLAGVAAVVIGTKAALFVPAAMMLAAALLLVSVTVPDTSVDLGSTVGAAAIAAIRYVWTNTVLRMLSVTMTIFNVCTGVLTIAIPFVVLRNLHGGSMTTGVLFAVMGGTGLLAGLVTGRAGTEGREKQLLALSCLVSAAAFVALTVSHQELVLGAVVAIVGATNGPLTVALFSLRQRATEPEWFGRAFAVSMNLNFVGTPIGASLAGLLLAHSVPLAFLLAAVCATVAGLWPAILPASSYAP